MQYLKIKTYKHRHENISHILRLNMDYLLISGTHNTGKTTLIYEITNFLITNGYVDITGTFPLTRPIPMKDFRCILQGVGKGGIQKLILVNSATDDEHNINLLIELFTKYPLVDIIITSIRDSTDPMRVLLLNRLNINPQQDFQLELPLARIIGQRQDFGVALTSYQTALLPLVMHILDRQPYNL
jgi:hypothetical protein